jgi:hypothetical protein
VQQEAGFEVRFKHLMENADARAFVWGLLEESGVLAKSLTNNTATVQSGLVAVRDFGMRHLLGPLLSICPERFLQMRAENDGSTADG